MNLIGGQFERWVARLFDELGYLRVRHNVMVTKKFGDEVVKSQFDIVYGLLWDTYVECKWRSECVSYADVSFFAGKLDLIGVPKEWGVVVTNAYVQPRAHAYAQEVRLKVIDGQRLRDLDWQRRLLCGKVLAPPPLEQQVMKEGDGVW